jgi:rhodanese-related sulfurtransferase
VSAEAFHSSYALGLQQKGPPLRAIDAGAAAADIGADNRRRDHIPYHQLWQRHAELAAGKADLIVVYCSHGPRAGMAKLQLWALGYRKLAYLKGQMSGWKREGLPMRIGRQPRRDGAAAQTQGAKSPLVRRAAKVRRSESAEGWRETVRAEDRARTRLLHDDAAQP